jgi:hypothetical protein
LSIARAILGEGIDQRRRRQPLLDVGFMREEFEVGEQHLDHAGAADKARDIGLGDGPPDCLELPSDRQILKVETEAHRLHTVLLERVIPDFHRHPAKAGIQSC